MSRPYVIPPPRPGSLPPAIPSLAHHYPAVCVVVRSSRESRTNAAAQAEHCLTAAAAYEECARVLRENADVFQRALDAVEVEL